MKIQSIRQDYGNLGQKNNTGKNTNFKRNWEEHISWGANYIAKTGKTNFKTFTFPDAKAVFVEIGDKASVQLSNIKEKLVQVFGAVGTAFAVNELKPSDDKSKIYPLENKGDGVFEAKNIDAKPDDKYRYIIVRQNDADKKIGISLVKDPYAKRQESIHGWSTVYDPNNYKWKNQKWINGRDARRIVRDSDDEKFRGLSNLRIEEINIPTITKEGTYLSAKKAIDNIAEMGIANAIEIMPVENTYSKQWGYDGVDKFAINEKMGTSAELKELIDYAHGKGLNVIMDMVPNHMGTDGDYLSEAGPYENGPGEFGALLNYETPNNRYVRDWMANAALWWANEYKVDGIRLDMTQLAFSDYLLKQIVDEVNKHNPDVFLIAEDGRNNKISITRYENSSKTHEEKIKETDMFIDFIVNGSKSSPQDVGFDSEWDFPFMHALKDAITNNNQASLNSIDDTMLNSQHRIKYIMSHDEIGNKDGTRLVPKIYAQYLNFFARMDQSESEITRGQKAAHLSQKIIELLVTNKNIDEKELKDLQKQYGINEPYDKTTLTNALKAAHAKAKLASGAVMTVPGPKMFFQGEENADLSYFKFFRDFSPEFETYPPNKGVTDGISKEKGYDIRNKYALEDSIVGQHKAVGEFAEMQNQLLKFNQDLVQIINDNISLQDGDLHSIYKDHENLVHIHSVESGNEKLLIFKNFADKFHNGSYFSYGFPHDGKYVEILNSDDTVYGGGGMCNKDREIDINNQSLNLAANSIMILKKVD